MHAAATPKKTNTAKIDHTKTLLVDKLMIFFSYSFRAARAFTFILLLFFDIFLNFFRILFIGICLYIIFSLHFFLVHFSFLLF